MDLTSHSEAAWLRELTSAGRVRFLAYLARNLTITGRLARAEQLRSLNEIQHRILGFISYALGPHEDPDFLLVVAKYVLDQSLRDQLARDWALARRQYAAGSPE